jgi:hypothetical protein
MVMAETGDTLFQQEELIGVVNRSLGQWVRDKEYLGEGFRV